MRSIARAHRIYESKFENTCKIHFRQTNDEHIRKTNIDLHDSDNKTKRVLQFENQRYEIQFIRSQYHVYDRELQTDITN